MKTTINLFRVVAAVGALGAGLTGAWAAPRARISAARANAVVLKRFPGRLAAKTPLEFEQGKWQYGVLVRSGKTLRDVLVDAQTGRITNVQVTTDAKERLEQQKDAAAAKARRMRKTSKTVKAADKGESESGAEEKRENGKED